MLCGRSVWFKISTYLPGGDQVVGRANAGLPINSKEFAILSSHFTSKELKMGHAIGLNNLVEGMTSFQIASNVLL